MGLCGGACHAGCVRPKVTDSLTPDDFRGVLGCVVSCENVGGVRQNDPMLDVFPAADKTATARKSRGAFFTPDAVARFVTDWAARSSHGTALEPSAGDAAFLVQVVHRLQSLGVPAPTVTETEIHPHSATVAAQRVRSAGGTPNVTVGDNRWRRLP